MDPLLSTIKERLEFIAKVKSVFAELYPHFPKRMRRGVIQRHLLSHIGVSMSGLNCQIVSEALLELGYEKVKITGTLYYRADEIIYPIPDHHPANLSESE